MTIEDELSDIAADLVSLKENHPFLRRLFSVDPGHWVALAGTCRDIALLGKRLSEPDIADVAPNVTWADYPMSLHGGGYCTIIFFAESVGWYKLALFNKGHFEEAYRSEHDVLSQRR
jgi:hypothetical protein